MREMRRASIRRHKYGAQATTVDGIRFSSKAEARRYGELCLLLRAGQIEALEVQPVFILQAPIMTGTVRGALDATAGGLRFVGRYIADFRYYQLEPPSWVVEDVKGVKTPLYRWKKKHMEAQYGITITEIGR